MFIIIFFIILKKEKKRGARGLISQNIFGQQITTTNYFKLFLLYPTCLSSLLFHSISFHSLLSLGFSSIFSLLTTRQLHQLHSSATLLSPNFDHLSIIN